MLKIFLIKLQKKSRSLNNIVYIVLSCILHNDDILKLQIIIKPKDIHRIFIHHSRLVRIIFKFILLLACHHHRQATPQQLVAACPLWRGAPGRAGGRRAAGLRTIAQANSSSTAPAAFLQDR